LKLSPLCKMVAFSLEVPAFHHRRTLRARWRTFADLRGCSVGSRRVRPTSRCGHVVQPRPFSSTFYHVQLVPFRFTSTQLVANEINHEREQHDVTGEGDPWSASVYQFASAKIDRTADYDEIDDSNNNNQPTGSLCTCRVSINRSKNSVGAPTASRGINPWRPLPRAGKPRPAWPKKLESDARIRTAPAQGSVNSKTVIGHGRAGP
jgi:hypothetical protein